MRYCLLVHTHPKEGKDAEFNQWYASRHAPDVLKIPGMLSARRFKVSDAQVRPGPRTTRYLAIYEIETDDLDRVYKELKARQGTPRMIGSDTVETTTVSSTSYELMSEHKAADQGW